VGIPPRTYTGQQEDVALAVQVPNGMVHEAKPVTKRRY
jgi:hypothetical protein